MWFVVHCKPMKDLNAQPLKILREAVVPDAMLLVAQRGPCNLEKSLKQFLS